MLFKAMTLETLQNSGSRYRKIQGLSLEHSTLRGKERGGEGTKKGDTDKCRGGGGGKCGVWKLSQESMQRRGESASNAMVGRVICGMRTRNWI